MALLPRKSRWSQHGHAACRVGPASPCLGQLLWLLGSAWSMTFCKPLTSASLVMASGRSCRRSPCLRSIYDMVAARGQGDRRQDQQDHRQTRRGQRPAEGHRPGRLQRRGEARQGQGDAGPALQAGRHLRRSGLPREQSRGRRPARRRLRVPDVRSDLGGYLHLSLQRRDPALPELLDAIGAFLASSAIGWPPRRSCPACCSPRRSAPGPNKKPAFDTGSCRVPGG